MEKRQSNQASKAQRARWRAAAAKQRERHLSGMAYGGVGHKTIEVSAAAQAELVHRSRLVPQSTTARLLGDPLPGYSALDMPRSASPSIVHDPLDDLIYGRQGVI